ncbi:glycosyltransferase [Flavobacterium filum]|uniref:glycosyltransferase n=1 Tax=Flavobacterium TaxID=237 RepID=UPI0004081523|nr:glycosyltransferase [Flavobacterium filum]
MYQIRKKILVIVTTFPSVSETFILNQITDLIDRGYDVTIFSYNQPNEDVKHPLFLEYNLKDKTFYHFKNEVGKLKGILYFLRFILFNFFKIDFSKFTFSLQKWKALYDLPVFLLKNKYDIIHCHFGFNGKKIAHLKKLNILKNEKCVLTFHGSDLTPSLIEEYKVFYKEVFRFFNAFTVNSPYLEIILKKIHPEIINLHILPVGFRKDYLEKIQITEKKINPKHIVFCGRLMPIKGPDNAILILNELVRCNYDVHLDIIGDGPMREDLLEKVKQLNLQNHITFHGFLTQNKVFEIMAQSSIFLLAATVEKETLRAETQGLVIQEAQFFKLPVVVSNIGGIPFGLIDGKTGFLIDQSDINLFVSKICLLIDNQNLQLSMGDKGHEFVQERFDSKILGEKLITIFDDLF